MNELQNIQIEVNYTPGEVKTNFELVKESLQVAMNEYKQFNVDATNKTMRKKDVATLRKGIKAVSDEKSKIRKECLKPYDLFSKAADELIEIINEPVVLIDNQIKELEEKERLIKKTEINSLLTQTLGDLLESISIELIYNDKWENATTTIKSIKEDIQAKATEIRQAINTIKGMNSEKGEQALENYYIDLNLSKAINTISTYEQQKREFEKQAEERRIREREQELEREKERVRREALAEIERENAIREEERQKAIIEQETVKQAELEAMSVQRQTTGTITVEYSINATLEEIEQIEMYLNSLGVMFTRR